MRVYDFKVKNAEGREVSLSEYAGKVLLIVNTATECGFTPQYAGLQEMYSRLQTKGLEILDFPCNQFGGQAPGSDAEIGSFCSGRFGVTFPRFAKGDVNGADENPLFTYLKKEQGFKGLVGNPDAVAMLGGHLDKVNPGYRDGDAIKWNFTKFLVNGKGEVVARFEPTVDVEDVEKAVVKLLG